MSKDRMDRFIWQEGEVELYDRDGNRLDPKTMKPVADDNSAASDIRKNKDENVDSGA